MRLFSNPKGPDFDKNIDHYTRIMSQFINIMEDVGKQNSEASTNSTFTEYIRYCRWPIRKLEYSYVLEKTAPVTATGIKVLDAGCGVTPLPFVLGDLGCDVVGMDLIAKDIALMQRLATQRAFPGSQNCTFQVGDICRLPYPDHWFDVVTCVSVLEHLPFPQYFQAIAELYRVLKPNGALVCTVDYWNGTRNEKGESAFNPIDLAFMLDNFKGELDKESMDYDRLHTTSKEIEEFWLSHHVPGIGYDGNRGYVAAGFTVTKSAENKVGQYNRALTRELLNQYLKVYSADQILIDLILLEFFGRKSGLPIVSSGREGDVALMATDRSYRLWEYRQIIKGLGIDEKGDKSILDLGGASCPVTYYATLQGYQVTSLDINEKIIAEQKSVAERLNMPNLSSKVMDMQNLSAFEDNSFDMVTSASVLEHLSVEGQIRAMKEVARVLKPGGKACISFDYGIPSPGANPDLPPPHEPPTSSSDVIVRYCLETGLEVVGNEFSNVAYPFCGDLYYTFAVLLLTKPGAPDISRSGEPANNKVNWEAGKSILKDMDVNLSDILTEMTSLLVSRNTNNGFRLDDSNRDREARLHEIEKLGAQLAESEADRAARLEIIERLNKLVKSQ